MSDSAGETRESDADGGAGSDSSKIRVRRIAELVPPWTRPSRFAMWALGLAIGVIGGYAVVAFRFLVDAFSMLAFGEGETMVSSGAAELAAWRVFMAPILGGVFVSIVLIAAQRLRWLREPRAEGVADVIEARAVRVSALTFRGGMASALVSAASLGSGASAGREGPAVNLGATLAGHVARRLNLAPRDARTLLACGAAAAVSASFNAPIAGVLFALEVVLGHYALAVFGPVTLASVAGAVVARSVYGNFPAFSIPESVDYGLTLLDLPAAFLLGVLAGVIAAAFLHGIRLGTKGVDAAAARMRIPVEWAAPLGGVVIGAIGVFYPHVLGVGYEAVTLALEASAPLTFLATLLVLKILATAVTLACRFGGGVFSPGLYLGAVAGAAFGGVLGAAAPGAFAAPTFYAMVGMGAVSGAVLGAPISTTLIVFELTAEYDMTIALLLAVSAATLVNKLLFGRSYFHWQLSRHGYDLSEGRQGVILKTIRVRSVMTKTPGNGDRLEAGAMRIHADDTLGDALAAFAKESDGALPVVENSEPDLVIGYLARERALEAYNRALIDIHVEEHR